MASAFAGWKQQFLAARGLSRATAAPLYSYRTSAEEFLALESLLRSAFEEAGRYGEYEFSERPSFSELFVLYASQWWQRRYNGSGFAWDPILTGIGAPNNLWSPQQRSRCVEVGLRGWGLHVHPHGMRFLGSIAFHGGLPVPLLASAHKTVGKVLSHVLRSASETTGVDVLTEWTARLGHQLPQAYRRQEIYALLSDIVYNVIALKKRVGLHSSDTAIALLDKTVPGWRDSFPFAIQDEVAKALIEGLVRDAVRSPTSKNQAVCTVARFLDQGDDGNWTLRGELAFEPVVGLADFCGFFVLDEDTLPRLASLRFTAGSVHADFSVRRIPGQNKLRMTAQPVVTLGDSATAEHRLALFSESAQLASIEVPGGAILNELAPWVFISDDTRPSCRLVREGGGTFPVTDIKVAIPKDWHLVALDGATADRIGELSGLNRFLYAVTGSLRIETPERRHFQIRCGQPSLEDDQYCWRGERVWQDFEWPKLAFSGVPRLFRVVENVTRTAVQASPSWKLPGLAAQPGDRRHLGPVEISWPPSGEIKSNLRFVHLPEHAQVTAKVGNQPLRGTLLFRNWGIAGAKSLTSGVTLAVALQGTVAELTFESLEGHPPEWVVIELTWPGNPIPARLRLPFPSGGARVAYVGSDAFETSISMAINQISGLRLIAYPGTTSQARLDATFIQKDGRRGRSVTRTVEAQPGSWRVEVRLLDLKKDIERLLADDDGLDARVQVTLATRQQACASVTISRYAGELDRVVPDSQVKLPASMRTELTVEQISNVAVCAVSMTDPSEETIQLEPVLSDDVPVGAWTVPIASMRPGPWLIYPASASSVQFRPLLWTVMAFLNPDPPDVKLTPLQEALGVSSESVRLMRLGEVIESLADDYTSPVWSAVEQFARSLGHLPMQSLDLWRVCARSPNAMAALAIRAGNLPAGWLHQVTAQMPVILEAIPARTWALAIRKLSKQCEIAADGNFRVATEVLQSLLDERIERLAVRYPALNTLLKVIKHDVLGTIDREVMQVRANGSSFDHILKRELFDGEQSVLQNLFRANAEREWPTHLLDLVQAARKKSGAEFMAPRQVDYRESVINVPILLAYSVCTNEVTEWWEQAETIRDVRRLAEFDADWFATAFDMTVQRCLAHNRITVTRN